MCNCNFFRTFEVWSSLQVPTPLNTSPASALQSTSFVVLLAPPWSSFPWALWCVRRPTAGINQYGSASQNCRADKICKYADILRCQALIPQRPSFGQNSSGSRPSPLQRSPWITPGRSIHGWSPMRGIPAIRHWRHEIVSYTMLDAPQASAPTASNIYMWYTWWPHGKPVCLCVHVLNIYMCV